MRLAPHTTDEEKVDYNPTCADSPTGKEILGLICRNNPGAKIFKKKQITPFATASRQIRSKPSDINFPEF